MFIIDDNLANKTDTTEINSEKHTEYHFIMDCENPKHEDVMIE